MAPSISSRPVSDKAVIVVGEFSKFSGLGEGARIMYQSLRKNHIPAHCLDVDPYSFLLTEYHKAKKVLSSYPHATLILHFNSPQIPFVLLNLPRHLLKNRKIIGYWAWELLVLPKEWEIGFHFVHEIWVPSAFVAKALQPWANKYRKTVKVVPHPLNDYPVSPVYPISREFLNLPRDRVIVLTSFNLSSSFARKNPLGAINAFKKACQIISKKKICLILKVAYVEHYQDDFRMIKQAIQGEDNIMLYTHLLNRDENKALIEYSDIVLSLHRSEGFGLLLAEAMQAGKAVISTDWSATKEFINQSCGIPVDYSLLSVSDSRMVYQIKNAYWAEPDCNAAAKAINTLFYNENYRNILGRSAQKNIVRHCDSRVLLNALSRGNDGIR